MIRSTTTGAGAGAGAAATPGPAQAAWAVSRRAAMVSAMPM
ncbi:hypothetical protein ACFJI0_25030 [Hydrogenophaga sp. UC242_53]